MKLNRETILKMREAGTSIAQIASFYGVTMRGVEYHLMSDEKRKARFEAASRRAADARAKLKAEVEASTGENNEINQKIRTLAATSDLSYWEIAQHLGVSKKRVKYWVNERERQRRSEEAKRRNSKTAEARKANILARVERKEEATVASAAARMLNQKFNNAKASARARGLEFDLTREQYAKMIETEHCERTGLALRPKGDGSDDVWTLDRINNTQGYAPGNVQIVNWMYNRAKGASTDAAVLRMAVALVNKAMADRSLSFEDLKAQTLDFSWD